MVVNKEKKACLLDILDGKGLLTNQSNKKDYSR